MFKKDVKFGDRFRTRDGRLAVYKEKNVDDYGYCYHYCMVECEPEYIRYQESGRICWGDTVKPLDIVSSEN